MKRVVLDQGLPATAAVILREDGWDAVHAREIEMVLNESYGHYPEAPEEFTGKLFRIYSWSCLLEFIKRNTCTCDEYPGVLQHYEIACLNHLVEVICTGPPRIAIGNAAAIDYSAPRIH